MDSTGMQRSVLDMFIVAKTNDNMNEFADKLAIQFGKIQTPEKLQQLIDDIETEAANTPFSTEFLVSTATVLSQCYDAGGCREYLDFAIAIIQPLVEMVDPMKPLVEVFFSFRRFALDLVKRYQLDGELNQLNLAIKICELGMASEYPNGFSNILASALYRRYESMGSDAASDLDRAIDIFNSLRNANGQTPADRATYEMNLTSALISRYERLSEEKDLHAAVVASGSCIDITPDTSPQLPARLDVRGYVLIFLFKLLGKKRDIDDAIELIDKALGMESITLSTKRKCLNNISMALRLRSEVTGSNLDLDRAIEFINSAVSDTPQQSLDQLIYRNTYATCLRLKFLRTGDSFFLNEAISAVRPIIPFAANCPYKSLLRITLCNALILLFEQTGSLKHLNDAIKLMEEAKSDSSFDPAIYHHSLAVALLKRFEKERSSDDIEKAVNSATTAVELRLKPSPDRSIFLNTLSTALQASRQGNDAREALEASMEAVKHTPKSHPDWGMFQFNLARAFCCLSEHTEPDTNFIEAWASYEKVVHSESSSPAIRIMAGIEAVNLFSSVDPAQASRILKIAVELLAKASPRTLMRVDQQYALSKFSWLASGAAALTLEANGSVYEAIRLLELGRGVMMQYRLDTRTEIGSLETQHPRLGAAFKQLRQDIESTAFEREQITSNAETSGFALAKSIHRNALSEKFDSLVGEIRKLAGFESFLKGPSIDEMKKLAEPGPLVFLNVSLKRCDAFIITHNQEPRSVPLTTNMKEIEEYAKSMKTLLRGLNDETYLQASRRFREILRWLWNCVAGPVLDSLGFRSTPTADAALPKIWWIPCGYLSFFPIHAAGDHKKGSTGNVIDCVISSYAPSLRLLAHARKMSLKYPIKNSEVLFISMPETPGQSPLTLDDEIATVKALLPIRILTNPCKEQTLSALQSTQLCFFGCHAESNELNPSQSRLLLKDWQHNPLTVADIVDLKLDHGRFAFLSACHSADNPKLDLLDESIHLAAAFQIAGFSHVVGSLWEVRDCHAKMIAEGVMGSMMGSDDGLVNLDQAAMGLHKKVRELRDITRRIPNIKRDVPPDPLVWAPYIYTGV